jgi:hypothetical protein
MRRYLESITAFGIGLAWLLGDTEMSHAQDNTVTAIDIALGSKLNQGIEWIICL